MLLGLSLLVNTRVARAADAGDRHRERLYEYYRNTCSQLGVILIGIGVSLFVFFIQQGYQDRYRQASEVRQLLAKVAVRVGRAAAVTEWFADIDSLVHYRDDDEYVIERGPGLARQIDDMLVIRRDVDLGVFSALRISEDIASSPLAGEMDPVLWFAITEDESEVAYGVAQMLVDFTNLEAALDDLPPAEAMRDPARAARLVEQVEALLFHMDMLRDRGRRLVGRGCWFLAIGPDFLGLKPVPELEANYPTHEAWIAAAERHLSGYGIGDQSCYEMLRFRRPKTLQG